MANARKQVKPKVRRRLKSPIPGAKPFNKTDNKPPGRPKGAPNKVTRIIKEAVILAAELVGQDGRGKDGMVGYLRRIAHRNPDLFIPLMGKCLPLQITGKEGGPLQMEVVSRSPEEIRAELQRRGITIDGVYETLEPDDVPALASPGPADAPDLPQREEVQHDDE